MNNIAQPNNKVKPNIDAIPATMRNQDRWVMWAYRTRSGGKRTKVPYMPNAVPAKSNDPLTWSSFGQCQRAMDRGKWHGIGFVLGDGFAGVDIDNCLDGGTLSDEARGIVDICRAPAKPSPSTKPIPCHLPLSIALWHCPKLLHVKGSLLFAGTALGI